MTEIKDDQTRANQDPEMIKALVYLQAVIPYLPEDQQEWPRHVLKEQKRDDVLGLTALLKRNGGRL